ncbi:S-methyl-5-thioribose-1-phosphate isomerase [Micromonospora sp. NPDC053740]|uniref:S-methyl-5-thioribose-1-phosphate isomerase n=1 Tax=Micromonospora TaxID=1873 RepID=UPI001EE90580|nr:S-methyl-5-thioribose-1-phosphate isomerase [Micromonospora alfalfae]MCG5461596.1 S-methyl-5-thioribose-1-phosphate isomerase [Micromonospora alfalfae]
MEEQFMQRSVDWEPGCVVAVDQTTLPHEMTVLHMTGIDQIITAIQRLAIRGAPALGLAGGLGVALSAHLHSVAGEVDHAAVRADAELLAAARPTAVNLRWGVQRALGRLADGPDAVLQEALDMITEDERTNRAAATRAATLIREVSPRRPMHVLTHCNTGRLATGGWGTALGAIRELAASCDLGSVLATETRPLLQGARLTVWELAEADIPHRLCIDSAAAAAMAGGSVDCVIVGADRIAANGDTANKIGTYALALAAARHGIPFIVVAPESSVDVTTPHGDDILIEDRPADEVLEIAGAQIAQPGTAVYNPAFDVTPIDLITAIVTEDRVIRPTRIGDTSLVRHVADFPQPGVTFRDLAGVYTDPRALAALARRLADTFRGRCDHVLAIESRGFPVGTLVAQLLGCPLTFARKAGKLPGAVHSVQYGLEYGADTLQVQMDALAPGARVLIVDDVLATGGTLAAAAELVSASHARTAGFGVLLEVAGLGGVERLNGRRLVVALADEGATA